MSVLNMIHLVILLLQTPWKNWYLAYLFNGDSIYSVGIYWQMLCMGMVLFERACTQKAFRNSLSKASQSEWENKIVIRYTEIAQRNPVFAGPS